MNSSQALQIVHFYLKSVMFSHMVYISQAYGAEGGRVLPDKDGNFFLAGSLDPATLKVRCNYVTFPASYHIDCRLPTCADPGA